MQPAVLSLAAISTLAVIVSYCASAGFSLCDHRVTNTTNSD